MNRLARSFLLPNHRPLKPYSIPHPSHSRTPLRIYRFASTTQTAAVEGKSLVTRLKNFTFGLSIILGLGFGYLYITDTRSSAIHQYFIPPLLRLVVKDAEEAHEVGTSALRALHTLGLHPRERELPGTAGDLKVGLWETVLDNPIAVSAGLDKKVLGIGRS